MDDFDSGILETVKDVAGSVVSAAGGELKKVGQAAISQVTGKQPAPTADEVAKLAKNDKNFSKKGETEVRARINAIYQEYATKQKKAQMTAAAQEQQEQEQKQETQELQGQKKQESMDLTVERSKAETGKNYGTE